MTDIDLPLPVKVRADRPAVLLTVAARALELIERRGSADPGELLQVFEADAGLTGAAFAVARSPIYGQPDRSLAESLDVIGPVALASLLRGLPRIPSGAPAARVEEACARWTKALAMAAAARWISNQGAYDDPAEAYVCGLATVIVDDPSRDGPSSIRAVAGLWRLGPRVTYILSSLAGTRGGLDATNDTIELPPLGDESVLRLSSVLSSASHACAVLEIGARSAALANSESQVVRPIDDAAPGTMPVDAAVLEAIDLELAHAASLLRLPPGPSHTFAARLSDEELRRSALEASAAEPSESAEGVLPQRLSEFQASLDALRIEASVQAIMERGVRAVFESLPVDRIVLVERDLAKPNLAHVRQVVTNLHVLRDTSFAGPEIACEPNSALAKAFDLRAGCTERLHPGRLDAPLRSLLGTSDAVIASVRAGSGSVGALIADNGLCGRPVSAAEAAAFGIASSFLGLVLENCALTAEGRTLRSLAEKDELTGICNRRSILDILRREMDRSRRYGKPLSIALVDVDHFKSWNDMHGHNVGDMVLRSVAQLISSVSREIDAFGRYGGEEFLVILPETAADHAMVYGERLRSTIEAQGNDLSAVYTPSSLTVSIGVTQLHPRGDEPFRMIQRADTALYAAKKNGRNRVCIEVSMSGAMPPVQPIAAKGILDEL